jgi:uncharacterized protein YecT (DUF1311 family)
MTSCGPATQSVNKLLVAMVVIAGSPARAIEPTPDAYSIEAPAYYYNKAVESCPSLVTACVKQLWAKADEDLNAIYQGRFSYLPRSQFNGLRAAQQAWALSRQKNCSWLAQGRQTDIYYLCMLEGSINRKYWLMRNIGD